MNPDKHNLVVRLRQKDVTLWRESGASPMSLTARLGWLDAVAWMEQNNAALMDWAARVVRSEKFDNIILLGMGGASLAAEVFSSVFASQPGHPRLMVVDTTSPAQISATDVNHKRSLIIVASKSGSTVETMDLYAYFYSMLQQTLGSPGKNFVAVTDRNSWLHRQAIDKEFMKIFLNPAGMGGRYSALSYFGLVPAALVGVNLHTLSARTKKFVDGIQPNIDHCVCRLARLMGHSALSGKNKMVLNIAAPLAPLAAWIEQLVAESTGKDGKGIIPILNPSARHAQNQVNDQFSVRIGLDCEDDCGSALAGDLGWALTDRYDLGSEFLRWQMATALAASIMRVNPFDQPDVEEAKHQTRLFINAKAPHPFHARFEHPHYRVYSDSPALATVTSVFQGAREMDPEKTGLKKMNLEKIPDGISYLAILAYLPDFKAINSRLVQIQNALQRRFSTTTTLGYGPRYLHSTGQLHKGGPPAGCFIQITEPSTTDIPVPERAYSFGDLHRAQADGDYAVMQKKGLPVMRITLKGDRLKALDCLVARL